MQNLVDVYNKTKSLYERYYDIHICSLEEIGEVISFIDTYWQKGHILTKSRELLDWQHLDKKNKRYNFVIAKSKKTGEIHGLIGFILSSIYDERIETPIRWGAIWKVRDDVAVKGLGLALKGYMETEVPVSYIGGVGLSGYSKAIDAKLGEKMGKLVQYYIANTDVDSYELICNPEFPDLSVTNKKKEKHFVRLTEEKFCMEAAALEKYMMPYKSMGYYVNRYYRHPIYTYQVVGIYNGGTVEAAFVFRKCTVDNRSCLFMADYIGASAVPGGCYESFLALLREEVSEYISFPCSGMDDACLKQAGFCKRDESDVILPVYYEPFVRSNVELDYHFWSEQGFQDEIMVKGDADQDRPNRLPEEKK